MFGEEESNWLKTLKEGDQVACNFGSYGYESYRILTISKVTPSGIIKTRTDSGTEYVFNPNGAERGRNRGVWGGYLRIVPLDEKVNEKIERVELLGKLDVNFKGLSTKTLRKLVEILEEEE